MDGCGLWAPQGRPYGFCAGRLVVVVEFYLADKFFGCGHSQVGLVLRVVALHYADEADDDVSAVVGLFPDQAVEFGGGCGHIPLGQVFVFGVDSLEGSLDVVSSEVALAVSRPSLARMRAAAILCVRA